MAFAKILRFKWNDGIWKPETIQTDETFTVRRMSKNEKYTGWFHDDFGTTDSWGRTDLVMTSNTGDKVMDKDGNCIGRLVTLSRYQCPIEKSCYEGAAGMNGTLHLLRLNPYLVTEVKDGGKIIDHRQFIPEDVFQKIIAAAGNHSGTAYRTGEEIVYASFKAKVIGTPGQQSIDPNTITHGHPFSFTHNNLMNQEAVMRAVAGIYQPGLGVWSSDQRDYILKAFNEGTFRPYEK